MVRPSQANIHSKARVLSPQRQNGLPLGGVTIIAKVTNGGASARKTNGHHSLFLPFKKSHKCCEMIYLTHASEKFHDSHEKKGKFSSNSFSVPAIFTSGASTIALGFKPSSLTRTSRIGLGTRLN